MVRFLERCYDLYDFERTFAVNCMANQNLLDVAEALTLHSITGVRQRGMLSNVLIQPWNKHVGKGTSDRMSSECGLVSLVSI